MAGEAFFKPGKDAWGQWVARQMASAVDGVPENIVTVILVEDGSPEGLGVMCWDADGEIEQDEVNNFILDTGVRALGMVSRVNWSPAPEVPTTDAWLLVVVPGALPAAHFVVRRLREDATWQALEPDGVPFFALSTASGLRAALAHGEPMVFKASQPGDRSALFNTVRDEEWPQEQADGRL